MIEIFVLIKLCRSLAAIAAAKNRSTMWGALGAVLWIAGELGFAVAGAFGGTDGGGLYGLALLGAVCGAGAAYGIVALLPPIPSDNGLPQARLL